MSRAGSANNDCSDPSEHCVIQLIPHLNLNAARLQQILQGIEVCDVRVLCVMCVCCVDVCVVWMCVLYGCVCCVDVQSGIKNS